MKDRSSVLYQNCRLAQPELLFIRQDWPGHLRLAMRRPLLLLHALEFPRRGLESEATLRPVVEKTATMR